MLGNTRSTTATLPGGAGLRIGVWCSVFAVAACAGRPATGPRADRVTGSGSGASEPTAPEFDLLIRGGTIYDGSGGEPRVANLAVRADRIAAIGNLASAHAKTEVDARGMAVAPGFINMLSGAELPLFIDGRAQSDLFQGITLEVFGEGHSLGPLNPTTRAWLARLQKFIPFEITWTSLREYLDQTAARGISPNIASFVGATTIREAVLGNEPRAATPDELQQMCELVKKAMAEGAMGVASALIYEPAMFADTEELITLARCASEKDGLYISHLRSEGNRLVEAVDELLEIAEHSGARAEIYHLKAAGRSNWPKLDQVIAKIAAARARGLRITANMYTYTAAATGLSASFPPWLREGGYERMFERLRDPDLRQRAAVELGQRTQAWENLYAESGPDKVILLLLQKPELRPLSGKTIAEIAAARGTSPEETVLDLVREDESRVSAVYFLMSEDNVRRGIALPYMSFGTDAGALASEGQLAKVPTHPRAYGTIPRLLGRYVRDEGIISLSEAIRRLTALPAENLRLADRGQLRPGFFADLVVFDPQHIRDRATYTEPHQYAVGVRDVWVNGEAVIRDGKHTGALPGRVVSRK